LLKATNPPDEPAPPDGPSPSASPLGDVLRDVLGGDPLDRAPRPDADEPTAVMIMFCTALSSWRTLPGHVVAGQTHHRRVRELRHAPAGVRLSESFAAA
jgi:hypothetical protein